MPFQITKFKPHPLVGTLRGGTEGDALRHGSGPFGQAVRLWAASFRLAMLMGLLIGGLSGCRTSEGPRSTGTTASVAGTPAPDETRPIILAFGDSLTAGYGLLPQDSYPVLLQQRLDEAGYRYQVVNAGVSGETSAGGLRRLEWSLTDRVELVILALGANDGLRGQPVEEMRQNLTQMIEQIERRGARVILAGMEAPPNLGPDYTRAFRAVYPDLARRYQLPLIPFLLEGVAGLPEYNQADGIHPNREGEKRLVENVWQVLQPLLGSPLSSEAGNGGES